MFRIKGLFMNDLRLRTLALISSGAGMNKLSKLWGFNSKSAETETTDVTALGDVRFPTGVHERIFFRIKILWLLVVALFRSWKKSFSLTENFMDSSVTRWALQSTAVTTLGAFTDIEIIVHNIFHPQSHLWKWQWKAPGSKYAVNLNGVLVHFSWRQNKTCVAVSITVACSSWLIKDESKYDKQTERKLCKV